MRILLTAFFCFIFFRSQAQTLDEWAQTVNWDGVTHWSKYINTSAAYFGPNALAVPALGNGSIDSSRSLELTGQFHFSKGDNTQTIALNGVYCLVKDVISFDVSFIPVEFYQASDAVKKERHVYYVYYNDKSAIGDVLVNANIRVLKKWSDKIQLVMRLGYRLPSSSSFGAARFIDGMGYHIDISAGKPFQSVPLKWIAMAGFYCWQSEKDDLRQDDAFLFGTGFEWKANPSWQFKTYVAGYIGYRKNGGDKPIVFRAETLKNIRQTSLVIRFQQGLHDFKYSTLEIGARYHFRYSGGRLAK